MNDQIIYQLALRTFTPEGTLRAAAERLEHVRELGIDIVYLCPFFKEDDDCDRQSWSPRQCASCTDNPKNPYKIADYFHVDSEYGTDEDLHFFMNTAHALGLKVFFDLVYLHCGKNAVFIKEHPDFIQRDEDGKPLVGARWPFARLNFASTELREYLKKNMEYLIQEYAVDGFRCDVGDRIPFDFWQEAILPLKEKYPYLLTLNEGKHAETLTVFDWLYAADRGRTIRPIFDGELPATAFIELYKSEQDLYGADVHRLLRMLDNHDTVSDKGLPRSEVTMTARGVEAALVLILTLPGVPFIWNGYELCDDSENNMFSNRFHGKRSAMNWSRAFTKDGKRRLHFLSELIALRHRSPALCAGELSWTENEAPEAVLSFTRDCKDESLCIVINTQNHPVTLRAHTPLSDILLQNGAESAGGTLTLEPYGYLIAKR